MPPFVHLKDKVQRDLLPRIIKCDEVVSDRIQQIVYIVAILSCWCVIFLNAYPLATSSSRVSSHHKYIGYGVFLLCVGSWRYASGTGPGSITEETLATYDNYPYDNVLFVPKVCPTLKIRKLPRSKYDRHTNRHIPRFDHFCGWLDQPVGEENYRFFLLFLVVHVLMCWYGSIITAQLLWGEVYDSGLLTSTFFRRLIALHYVLFLHFNLALVWLLMTCAAAVLSVFLIFHLYITVKGMTTNEYFKWRELKELHRQGQVLIEGTVSSQIVPLITSCRSRVIEDTDITCTGPASETKFTLQPDKRVLGNVGRDEEASGSEEGVIINFGPMPRNIYDRGIVENFMEVIHPRSIRKSTWKTKAS